MLLDPSNVHVENMGASRVSPDLTAFDSACGLEQTELPRSCHYVTPWYDTYVRARPGRNRAGAPLSAHTDDHPRVAFVYDEDAHVEPTRREAAPELNSGPGLFGRHVANSEFLDAWLSHGNWQRMVGVVASQRSGDSLASRFRSHPDVARAGRELEIVGLPTLQERFFPAAPAQVLHLPQPIEPQLAWARHHRGRHGFALSGVTHTISSKEVMEWFRELVTAPLEPYDTLFCISKAALSVVRTVTDNYAAYLRERHGGEPRVRARLAHVPLGVDTRKYRPATNEERDAARREFGIAPDAVCVMFVGRLSHSSKVHPFPIYRATAEAARRVGCKVHLVLAGWSENRSIQHSFQEGAEALAPGVTTSIVLGTHPENRFRIWHAADVFTSLSDNIQETLGLTILEAQACGLPSVVSDWDGCRDGVVPGQTGFLVTTRMLAGTTTHGTSQYLIGATSYGKFLGETNQCVAVDAVEASDAFARLFADSALRARMGSAARAHVLEAFTWPLIIRQYESVWHEQEAVRREHAGSAVTSTVRTPVSFPDVEYSFASYPSTLLGSETRVIRAPDAADQLEVLLRLPLTNYLSRTRIADRAVLIAALECAAEPTELAVLEVELGATPSSTERRRATLAWMLKYDLLRVVPAVR